MFITLWLIIPHINLLLPCILLNLVVISWSECIYVHYTSMCEYLVVYQGWEAITSQTESNVTS